jgi:CheY-like chemotaxis protein
MSTILVVDDEPTILNLCQRMLQAGGYEVVQAASGEAALRVASDPQHSIDLALLDIMMPIMNGIELASRLQAAHPELPIVLMTGFTVREIERIVADHPYRIIWKPFKTDSLLRMIDNALGQSAGTTAV